MLSQSDFLKKKRMVTILKEQTKLPPVLDSALYTLCMEYGIVKKIQTLEKVPVLDNCPDFLTCINTNTRVNRKPMIKRMVTFHPIYVKDRHLIKLCCDDIKREKLDKLKM